MDKDTLYILKDDWLEDDWDSSSLRSCILRDYTDLNELNELTLEDIREYFESESSCQTIEEIADGALQDYISDEDALAEILTMTPELTKFQQKLKTIISELDGLSAEANSKGLQIKDFGEELLDSMGSYGWNTSSWFC